MQYAHMMVITSWSIQLQIMTKLLFKIKLKLLHIKIIKTTKIKVIGISAETK